MSNRAVRRNEPSRGPTLPSYGNLDNALLTVLLRFDSINGKTARDGFIEIF
jgi:hypothetical protein